MYDDLYDVPIHSTKSLLTPPPPWLSNGMTLTKDRPLWKWKMERSLHWMFQW